MCVQVTDFKFVRFMRWMQRNKTLLRFPRSFAFKRRRSVSFLYPGGRELVKLVVSNMIINGHRPESLLVRKASG